MSAVPESVVSTVKDRLPFGSGAQGFFFEDKSWAQREYRAAMEAMYLQLGVSLINQLCWTVACGYAETQAKQALGNSSIL